MLYKVNRTRKSLVFFSFNFSVRINMPYKLRNFFEKSVEAISRTGSRTNIVTSKALKFITGMELQKL